MSNFLVLRGETWYVRLDVPAYARGFGPIGDRKVLTQSLRTGSEREAKDRALPILAEWKRIIAAAKTQSPVPTAAEFEASQRRRTDLLMHGSQIISELAEEIGYEAARDAVATELSYLEYESRGWRSHLLCSEETVDAYRESAVNERGLKLKTIDARVAAIKKIRSFLFSNRLNMDVLGVRAYLSGSGIEANTKRNHMQAGADFWRFLCSQDVTLVDRKNPFLGHVIRESRGRQRRSHMSVAELSAIYGAALERDAVLAALIKLAAYTGARIEEVCQLKKADVRDDQLFVNDAKTVAGNRAIPIHPKIRSLVKKLVRESEDGFLIESTSNNKYGIRSDALSKKFGRLKVELGYGPEVVFHSIRKLFITLLEQADVPENVTADIVGHKKNTMSYGVYSGGTSLEQRQRALEAINFDL